MLEKLRDQHLYATQEAIWHDCYAMDGQADWNRVWKLEWVIERLEEDPTNECYLYKANCLCRPLPITQVFETQEVVVEMEECMDAEISFVEKSTGNPCETFRVQLYG